MFNDADPSAWMQSVFAEVSAPMSSASDSRTHWMIPVVTVGIIGLVAFLVVDVMLSDLGQLQGTATIAPALDEPALMLRDFAIIGGLTLVAYAIGVVRSPQEVSEE